MLQLIFLAALSMDPADSLRLETVNGKTFVIHQVGEKETLYGLSKRYGATITSILEFNPTADAGLEVGQLMKIPYTPRTRTPANGSFVIHRVAAKETLYSIARVYGVSVDDLQKWNKLTSQALAEGQELTIKRGAGSAEQKVPEKSTTGAHVVTQGETLYSIARLYGLGVQQLQEMNNLAAADLRVGQVLKVKPDDNRPAVIARPAAKDDVVVRPAEIREPAINISEGMVGSDEVRESGLAELIEGTEGNRKYLALHRTAKEGTIMKVRNELNNREVFVRVAGPLPNTGVNDKLVIKISRSAYDRLAAIDPKFRVEVTYYK
jgi:LysM repeat protein